MLKAKIVGSRITRSSRNMARNYSAKIFKHNLKLHHYPGGVRDTEVTGISPRIRSEALECAQLAAAFACASLLAAGLCHGRPAREGAWPGRPRHQGRKRASGRESGSKLHA